MPVHLNTTKSFALFIEVISVSYQGHSEYQSIISNYQKVNIERISIFC